MSSPPITNAAERRILVTGACGFLGSHLIRSWADARTVFAGVDDFSRVASRNRESAVRPLCSSFLSQSVESVDPEWFRAFAPTHVVHLAAQVGLVESWQDPEADFRANAQATWHLLCALRALPTAPAFVFVSSNKVYGQVETSADGVSEDWPIKPDSPYALGKAAGELATGVAHRAGWIHGSILRCSCLYGPAQMGTESQGWVSHFSACAAEGRPITRHGTGDQIRDALHVDDWLRAAAAALDHRGGPDSPGCWNIGGGNRLQTSPNALWRRLADLLGRPLPEPIQAPGRAGDQSWYVSDIRRAEKELGWRPLIDLNTGLRTLLP